MPETCPERTKLAKEVAATTAEMYARKAEYDKVRGVSDGKTDSVAAAYRLAQIKQRKAVKALEDHRKAHGCEQETPKAGK